MGFFSKDISTLNDLFVHTLKDIYYAEKQIRDAFANQTSVHHGHCHEITIDSDSEAHGVIAMEDYIRGLDRKTHLLHAAGHYWETYRYEDGAWRIASSKLTRLFNDVAEDKFYAAGVNQPQVAAE